ncbi:hypothetical protein KHS38_12920 [Mucilaginibacter sp. Bleaf8]|uniref:hypothetical protein n=1 Tax=Mucilaginibacter sp. Bleaf8 TaxID=2834430 RepID=UPI001BCA711A|nr:hypothetical protein [Mucilaginibacter sp. Bleaf8]MBS7565308.1 hypothetical protein [Mucilaginibacter sp. Bleaf8]
MSWKQTYHPVYTEANWKEQLRPLTIFSHIAHIHTAIRILQDGKCKAGLVFDDESRLYSSRTLVNWLSPNRWHNGSRYGNVVFEVSFEKISNVQYYYWVETRDYNAVAHRFLLTDLEHPELKLYDPAVDNGPWRYDAMTKTHYWDSQTTVEFMLEADIPVATFDRIDTCHHHKDQCCIDTANCDDKNTDSQDAAAQFIAKVIASDAPILSRHFTTQLAEGQYPANILVSATGRFKAVIDCAPPAAFAWLSGLDDRAHWYVKAALHALEPYKSDGFNTFSQAFNTPADAINAFALTMAKKFELTDARSLGYKD